MFEKVFSSLINFLECAHIDRIAHVLVGRFTRTCARARAGNETSQPTEPEGPQTVRPCLFPRTRNISFLTAVCALNEYPTDVAPAPKPSPRGTSAT